MKFKFLTLLATAALLQACSSLEVTPGTFKGDPAAYKNAYVGEVNFTAPEGNADELKQTKEFEKLARTKLDGAIAEKHLNAVQPGTASAEPTLVLSMKSTINYGIRGARMVSLVTSAGQGTVSSTLEARDSRTNEVVYTASAESVLKTGVAGGGMDSIIEDNIDELVESFVNPE